VPSRRRRRIRNLPAAPAPGRHHFTDPSVSPRTTKRWPTNIKSTAGMVEITDAAANSLCCTSYCWAKRAMAARSRSPEAGVVGRAAVLEGMQVIGDQMRVDAAHAQHLREGIVERLERSPAAVREVVPPV
jgi:hypothetical protein